MWRWIDTAEALESVAVELGHGGALALDTEADSFHHYREKTCLVQLSFGGADVLIDPLRGFPLDPLTAVLSDPGRRKILHGAGQDLRLLHRDHRLVVRGLFDTQVAARLVGERSFGLAALLERRFAVRLDKRFQRADWSVRPLPRALQAYAAMDTHHLEPLAGLLETRLAELGRAAWAAEEFRRIEDERLDARTPADEERFRRVKGAARLDRRGLAVLRAVHALREAIAERQDVPPFRVMGDDVLLALAEARPRSEAEFAAIPGLARRRGVQAIVEAVVGALGLPEVELPARAESRRVPRDPRVEARLRRACLVRDRTAAELDLEPPLLASRGLLEALLERLDLGLGVGPADVPALRHWQAALLGPTIEALAD